MNNHIAFYITNHGYGHASRNVPIIERILNENKEAIVYIKTDFERILFFKRNLVNYENQIVYFSSCCDVGLPLHEQTLEVDVEQLQEKIINELQEWPSYIKKELLFLQQQKVDIVISDVIPWILLAAKKGRIPSILLCNFTWYEMYKEFLPDELTRPYYEAYKTAGKIFLYTLGNNDILHHYSQAEQVSLVSRRSNKNAIAEISRKYKHPIIFVSVGKSISMDKEYNVSGIPGTFLITSGVRLKGENVIKLPLDLINTQDYIGASDYIISKTGWSTLAEIYLNQKKAAVIARGNNPEDNAVIEEIRRRKCGVLCTFDDLEHIEEIMEKLDSIQTKTLNDFYDDCERIVKSILLSTMPY